MYNNSPLKSHEDFCYNCEHYDFHYGTCSEIHENISDYPEKFKKKCDGRLFVFGKSEKFLESKEKYHKSKHQPTEETLSLNDNSVEVTTDPWKEKMELRLTELEKKIPISYIIHHNFWRRAWTVFGYNLVTMVVIYGAIFLFSLLIYMLT